MNRRAFLKMLGLVVAGCCAAPVTTLLAVKPEERHVESALATATDRIPSARYWSRLERIRSQERLWRRHELEADLWWEHQLSYWRDNESWRINELFKRERRHLWN